MLAPFDFGSQYWKAPPSASSVEFGIVLGDLSDVNGVILMVSPCGYSLVDAPIVSPHSPCVLVFFELFIEFINKIWKDYVGAGANLGK